MGTQSKVEWTLHTWNPWQGCHKVSEACANCYMYREKKRYGQNPKVVVRSKSTFYAPLKRNRHGRWKWPDGDRIFVCSWSDFFHSAADQWRAEAWEIIKQRPGLDFMILTKRPERMVSCLPRDWRNGWSNVWLGVTAENQKRADERLPILLNIPAVIHFVTCEPLLEQLELASYLDGSTGKNLDWIVAGSESGHNRRPSRVEWFRSIRDQCQQARIPFFLKQMEVKGKLVKMAPLDGTIWEQYPQLLHY